METHRSDIPGYEATILTLSVDAQGHSERFLAQDQRGKVEVSAVTQFDEGYFTLWGADTAGCERELDVNFRDLGVLPPHVREALPQIEGIALVDHAPEERAMGPEHARQAERSRAHRSLDGSRPSRAKGGEATVPRKSLSESEVARLRLAVGVDPDGLGRADRKRSPLALPPHRQAQLRVVPGRGGRPW